jgi:hypothetical protein
MIKRCSSPTFATKSVTSRHGIYTANSLLLLAPCPDIAAKRLGLLHELAPKAAVIAVLLDPNGPGTPAELQGVRKRVAPSGRKSCGT